MCTRRSSLQTESEGRARLCELQLDSRSEHIPGKAGRAHSAPAYTREDEGGVDMYFVGNRPRGMVGWMDGWMDGWMETRTN
jgi:hypothetical protein